MKLTRNGFFKILLALLVLVLVGVVLALMAMNGKRHLPSPPLSSLDQARALQPPEPQLVHVGESEHVDWWDTHEELLNHARNEWGRKHPKLYQMDHDFQDRFLDADLVRAVTARDKELFASLFRPTIVPNVYTFRLFTAEFAKLMLEEIGHQESSGIPMRRPNGMNRYGAILSELGFSEMIHDLVNQYLVVMARHLFVDRVGPNDLSRNYPFLVRYQPGQDTSLSEHTDASTVTVNICLQPSSLSDNVLYFKGDGTRSTFIDTMNATFVDLSEAGQAVIHLGQHRHGVSNITSNRDHMVVWMFGDHGYVRVAEYEPEETAEHVRLYERFWRSATNDEFEL